jgi:hypothetical protein
MLVKNDNKHVGSWGLGAGNWELGAGDWELGARDWELGAGSWGLGNIKTKFFIKKVQYNNRYLLIFVINRKNMICLTNHYKFTSWRRR